MGKRSNIRATARNTSALVAHAERDELVSRGVLHHSASVADAARARRRLRREAHKEAVQAVKDSADPKGQLIFVAVTAGILIPLAALVGSTVLWWITVWLVGASLYALLAACNDANLQTKREQNTEQSGSS